ncbi:MAG: protein kinase domain-containing protein [Planctomycetota bacterium]|jgi:non-specific serine/threonine protein kinase
MTSSSDPASSSSFAGDLAPGQILGERYRIVAMVGEGGMGQVYLSDDLVLECPVALKLLPDRLAENPAALERFLAEVRLAREVSHPCVARVHDIAEFDGRHVLSMEFVDGETLESLMRRIGHVPREKATQIAVDLCSALLEVHRKGILHRDLKPANIMLDGEGRVRLTDFGLAVSIDESDESSVAGTPPYMAPEQLRGMPPGTPGEVYSLGLLLTELFTGQRMVEADAYDEVLLFYEDTGTLTVPGELVQMAPRVAAILDRCLSAAPTERPGLDEVQRAFENERSGSPFSDPAIETVHAPPSRTNLPAPSKTSDLVGRKAELAELESALETSPLVTLAGPGGSGKTRLALEVGTRAQEQYPGGVFMVELSGLRDGALLSERVASSLELESPTTPLEAVIKHLAESPTLLVLDNCEHLIEAAAELADQLLQGAPNSRLLATSQEPLGVDGETIVRLGPLGLPAEGGSGTLEELGSSESVRLFAESARAAHRDFELTEGNVGAVVEICRRLDGIPLAIKLAAARAGMISPDQIARRLDQRFQLLTGGRRGQPDRQRTLRGALDWSHDLLTEGERLVFRRLAAFTGSFTLAAAEAVAWDDDEDPWARLDDFTRLVDRSLVLVKHQPTGEVRYRMLETIRAYAADRLTEAGESEELRARHRRHYRDMALKLFEEYGSPATAASQSLLVDELDNLRLVLDARDGAELEESMHLVGQLAPYWSVRGLIQEALVHLERLLEQGQTTLPVSLIVDPMFWAGRLSQLQGRLVDGEDWFRRLLELSSADGNVKGSCRATSGLGNVAQFRGRADDAEGYYTQSLEFARELGDKNYIATALGNLGVVATNRQDFAKAREYAEEALVLFRELGLQVSVCGALNNISTAYMIEGDLESANRYARECLRTRQAQGDRHGLATSHVNIGTIELRLGNLEQARLHILESLSIDDDLGVLHGVASSLETYAEYALKTGELPMAVRTLAAAASCRVAIGVPIPEQDRADVESVREQVASTMSPDQFSIAWEKASQAPVEELVNELLADHPGV